MTSGIAVTPERLREISARLSSGAADVEAILSRLSGNIAPVRTEWVGPAQAQFNTLWDQLQHDAGGLHSTLTGIAKLTENAAAAYEAAEQSIARSFDAFRVEQDVHTDTEIVAVQEVAVRDETEAEDQLSDEADPTADRPKASIRLPWTRFMAKTAQESESSDIVISTRRHERRFNTSDPALKPGTRLCRLCFTVVVLEPEYIETTATHAYVCCPHCGRSFPVRRSDVEALLTGQSPNS